MAKLIEKMAIELRVKVKISLWDAIKYRIAGKDLELASKELLKQLRKKAIKKIPRK